MVDDTRLSNIRKNGWTLSDAQWTSLDDYHKDFFHYELGGEKSIEFYRKRLKGLGLDSPVSVLDAGCGIGQWSQSFATFACSVESVDLMPDRIKWAKEINFNPNINFNVGDITKLPFLDNSFDVVFCYGVFMFADYEKALSEFRRVLKPNGKLYINVNSFGWYLYLFFHRKMFFQVMAFIKNSLSSKKNNIIYSFSKVKAILENCNFEVKSISHEGGIGNSQSIYKKKTMGLINVIEVLAHKS